MTVCLHNGISTNTVLKMSCLQTYILIGIFLSDTHYSKCICLVLVYVFDFGSALWLVGFTVGWFICVGFIDSLRQDFSPFQTVSQREGKERSKGGGAEKRAEIKTK